MRRRKPRWPVLVSFRSLPPWLWWMWLLLPRYQRESISFDVPGGSVVVDVIMTTRRRWLSMPESLARPTEWSVGWIGPRLLATAARDGVDGRILPWTARKTEGYFPGLGWLPMHVETNPEIN